MGKEKEKTVFICSECGFETPRWLGRCPDCGAWNTLAETLKRPPDKQAARAAAVSPATGQAEGARVQLLPEVAEDASPRASTGDSELDRVLGGGVVRGAVMLLAGDPGIGKSTLLLQVMASMQLEGAKTLYISGEESARQIKMRATRLGLAKAPIHLLAETAVDVAIARCEALKPDIVVVDSIQTMVHPDGRSVPGSVSQVRDCGSAIMRYAKESGASVFLVGHVTKEGTLAGPRILEHMVDAVLYFEGDKQQEYRLLRAVKNRFGSVNELGVFRMTEKGMEAVDNPSETLLSARAAGASGSVVFCALQGSRPLLVDVQGLAAQSYLTVPRRTVSGMDQGRVALLLAVLEKRAGKRLYDQDVYINVAGGLTIQEPAADLAVIAAVTSSLSGKALPPTLAVMGEVGLCGEVRAIPQAQRRVMECARLGFTTVLLPRASARSIRAPEGASAQEVRLLGVDTLREAIDAMQSLP